MSATKPKHLDLKKTEGLHIEWADGTTTFFPIDYLRKMSPAADQRELRRKMAQDPLFVLPAGSGDSSGPLTATGAELVGNYAIRIHFSDDHSAGIYSWDYLREIAPKDE